MFVPGLELGFEFLEQAAICSVFHFLRRSLMYPKLAPTLLSLCKPKRTWDFLILLSLPP